jgi:putative ABC transport system permease protein
VVSVPIIAAVGRAAIVDVGSVTPLIFPMSEAIGYAVLAILAAVLAAVIPAWKTTQAALAPQLRDE